MEKIAFTAQDTNEEEEFYVLEKTTIGGQDYLLVADAPDEDATCLILKDTSESDDPDALYEIVEEDAELDAIVKVFDELLDEVEIER